MAVVDLCCYLQSAKNKIRMSTNTKFFLIFLAVRLSSVFLVQTWYVPDEYWQSMEVAHDMVFGYGYRTWEWVLGLRSYLHPLLIATLYKALQLLELDTVQLLVVGPRICQAVLSAYADLKFYHWCGNSKWAAFVIASSWFWFYTGSRTLINTFETCLTTIALADFPWPGSEHKGGRYLRWMALACAARPTAALLWLPLCLYHLGRVARDQLRGALLEMTAVGGATLICCALLDSLCHGAPLLSPWEFLRQNLLRDVGSHYGTQPWHWYLTSGLPAVLGLHTVTFAVAAGQTVRRRHERPGELALLAAVAFSVAALSCVPHKEFRFMLPLLPMALHGSARLLWEWSRQAARLHLWLVAAVLLVSNALPAAYLGLAHQRGTLDVMQPLARLAAVRPNDTSLLFLMPCHSTPLYSHLHVPVPTRFLTCEPQLDGPVQPDHKDEADRFYEDPLRWLHDEFAKEGSLPSHIVLFDGLVPAVSGLLKRYEQLHEFAHAAVPASSRHGGSIFVYQHVEY